MKIYSTIFAALVVFFISVPAVAFATTEITQEFVDKNNLFKSGEEYLITTDVIIPEGKEVIIEKGATIQLLGGQLIVKGKLNLQGAEDNPVLIELINHRKIGAGIYIQGGELQIMFAKMNSGEGQFIEVVNGSVGIAHSKFENIEGSRSFILAYSSSTVSLADNRFINIQTPHVLEIYNNSKGLITQNSFNKTGSQSVISIFDGWGQQEKSQVAINDSIFTESLGRGVEVFNGAALLLNGVSIAESVASGLLAYSNSTLDAKNSSFEKNDIGIEAYNSTATLLGNSIEGNRSGGIVAYGSSVQAASNWWGSVTGPFNDQLNPRGDGQSVTNDVLFTPWLMEKPKAIPCCSSILFIPGLQGSRLYLKNRSENQLWEPNTNADVKKLYLDDTGKSIEENIYTRDIISKTNLTGSLFGVDIYESFAGFLQELVSKNTISSWKAFPYDWRLSAADIASNQIDLGGAFTSLLATFEELLKNSKTGKVSIIAHSNGGLIAKNFIKNLINAGKGSLVDQLILVAVPEFGAPQAIADMLHGDSQSILGGIILSKSTARNLGANMSSAYELLPSQEYFATANSPVVSFSQDSDPSLNPGIKYGTMLTNRQQLGEFLISAQSDRGPAKSVDEIAVLNGKLLNKSEELHQSIDKMLTSSSTPLNGMLQVSSIVGIGNETMTGIIYKHIKNGKKVNIERTRTTSIGGDGVVLAGEPTVRSGDVYAVDVKSLSLAQRKNVTHTNILNAPTTQQVISSIIRKNISSLPPFVSKQATLTNVWKRYEFTVHSPVSIMAYDTEGNRTGLLKEPTENEIGISLEEIPGSQYVNFGEAKKITTTLPPEKVILEGLDSGVFRFTVEEFDGDRSVQYIEYSNVPTTKGMMAEFVSASSSVMTIDYNADGHIDKGLLPDTQSLELNLSEAIKVAMAAIRVEIVNSFIQEKYLRELKDIQKDIEKGKNEKAAKELERISTNLANAMETYNFVQKKLKAKKFVDSVALDTTALYFHFKRLSSISISMLESI